MIEITIKTPRVAFSAADNGTGQWTVSFGQEGTEVMEDVWETAELEQLLSAIVNKRHLPDPNTN